jgi:beta-glucosidase
MNPALSPDARARLLNAELTLDERIALLHSKIALPYFGSNLPPGAIGSVGYIPAITRLHIPALQETDAGEGVTNPLNVRPGDGATPLPAGLAQAASFDPAVAYASGAMIGREAWSKGLNVLLAGGVNLARDPRNGRNFEYFGEDPLLSGLMAGAAVRGIQDQHVLATVKHFPLYSQETGGRVLSAVIDEAALRESDLLAFEIAVERGEPGSVLCAYDRINGVYACEDAVHLNGVLKGDWGYPGFVMSDWGAVHSTAAALAGLDQESGEEADTFAMPGMEANGPAPFFAAPLKAAVEAGATPLKRLKDMDYRILRSMFAVGLFDHPATRSPIDYEADAAVAKTAATEGMVLLIDRAALLPLAKSVSSIALIGGEADAGVLSGGGSSDVAPVGGPARVVPVGGEAGGGFYGKKVFDPSSPLKAIRAKAKGARVVFNDGRYPSAAAAMARSSDVAIVFVNQWMGGAGDAPDLSLPSGQDALIQAVAAANPRTIVVLQTGGPVRMPWLGAVGAVLEAWYPGAKGGEAIADVLFGDADPGGRLPLSFPVDEGQLPRPDLPGAALPVGTPFDLPFSEGSDVGYRWYAKRGAKPLFAFGYGLSYARFQYKDLVVTGGDALKVSFTVQNTSQRPGSDAPQVYLTHAPSRPLLRLVGFEKLRLKPGEARRVTLVADSRLLADFDSGRRRWILGYGSYGVGVGSSSADLSLRAETTLKGREINP